LCTINSKIFPAKNEKGIVKNVASSKWKRHENIDIRLEEIKKLILI
jgi:hypothetical protein